MQHKVKVTVLDKKLYPELQAQYCADPQVGACPCYNVGDEYIFERYGKADDFWHMGLNTLTKCTGNEACTAGGSKMPHCSEAWDAIARYIYTGLQGGSIMRGWMKDEREMITCCSDGTRPVIFRIRRLDYLVVRFAQPLTDAARLSLRRTLCAVPGVTEVQFRGQSPNAYAEVYIDQPSPAPETLKAACEQAGVPATIIE